jgi:Nucleoside transporter
MEVKCGYVHTVTKPLFVSSALFSIIAMSCFFDLSGVFYFYFCFPIISALGFSTIFLTSGIFARSASYQATSLSQGAMVGQAVSGIVVSVLSYILASNSGANDDDNSIDDQVIDDTLCNVGSSSITYNAQIYFCLVSATMWTSLLLFMYSRSNDIIFYKTVSQLDLVDNSMDDSWTNVETSQLKKLYEQRYDGTMVVTSAASLNVTSSINEILDVMFSLKFFISIIMITFAGTLSIFPALVSEIWECRNINNASFTSLLFSTFNISDAVGRSLSALFSEFSSTLYIMLISIAIGKFFLVPLLCRADIHGEALESSSCTDWYPALLVCVLGLTNGFCASSCMMHWVSALGNSSKENLGATLMIFSITIGLIIGSSLSYLVIRIALDN